MESKGLKLESMMMDEIEYDMKTGKPIRAVINGGAGTNDKLRSAVMAAAINNHEASLLYVENENSQEDIESTLNHSKKIQAASMYGVLGGHAPSIPDFMANDPRVMEMMSQMTVAEDNIPKLNRAQRRKMIKNMKK